MSFESGRSLLPQATNSGSSQQYPSSLEVFNIKEILLEEKNAQIALYSARTYKGDGTVGITRRILAPVFIDTGAGAKPISKAMLFLSWRI